MLLRATWDSGGWEGAFSLSSSLSDVDLAAPLLAPFRCITIGGLLSDACLAFTSAYGARPLLSFFSFFGGSSSNGFMPSSVLSIVLSIKEFLTFRLGRFWGCFAFSLLLVACVLGGMFAFIYCFISFIWVPTERFIASFLALGEWLGSLLAFCRFFCALNLCSGGLGCGGFLASDDNILYLSISWWLIFSGLWRFVRGGSLFISASFRSLLNWDLLLPWDCALLCFLTMRASWFFFSSVGILFRC